MFKPILTQKNTFKAKPEGIRYYQRLLLAIL